MKSKEKPEFDFEEAFTEYELSQIREAMKQEAIAFAEWYCVSDWSLQPDEEGKYLDIETGEKKTIEVIYNIYLESKKQ